MESETIAYVLAAFSLGVASTSLALFYRVRRDYSSMMKVFHAVLEDEEEPQSKSPDLPGAMHAGMRLLIQFDRLVDMSEEEDEEEDEEDDYDYGADMWFKQ